MHLQGAPPWRVLARIVYASSHATRTLFHPHQPLFLRVTPQFPLSVLHLAPLFSRVFSLSLTHSLSSSSRSLVPPSVRSAVNRPLLLRQPSLASRLRLSHPLPQRQPRSVSSSPLFSLSFQPLIRASILHPPTPASPPLSLSSTLCSSPALDSLSS